MKFSKDPEEPHRTVLISPEECAAKKELPRQSPWIRWPQEILWLVVSVVFVVFFYNFFESVGKHVPEALKSATSYLEQEQSAAASRLAAVAAAEKLRRQNPASPSATRVFARALSGAPGAIICGDYQAVTIMLSLYNRHMEDRLQDSLTKGLSRSIRGESSREPDPSIFGCAVIPDGQPMMKEPTGIFPVVSAQLNDGTYIKGITMAPMINNGRH